MVQHENQNSVAESRFIQSKDTNSNSNVEEIENNDEIVVDNISYNDNNSDNEKGDTAISEEKEEEFVSSTRNYPTPLPKKKVFIVFIMFLCDACSFTTLVPYIGFMVAGFNLSDDDRLLGYYAGFIASSYFVAQMFSCPFWGYASDKIGRRPILLTGVVGSCITILMFGFSKTYWMAILSRSLFGLLNGNIGVYKTYLGEITDSSNQSAAFSMIGLTVGAGSAIGPIVGGYLSRPVLQYPWLFDHLPNFIRLFFSEFPYLLPNILLFVTACTAVVLGFIYLTESNEAVLQKRRRALLLKQGRYNELEKFQTGYEKNGSHQIQQPNVKEYQVKKETPISIHEHNIDPICESQHKQDDINNNELEIENCDNANNNNDNYNNTNNIQLNTDSDNTNDETQTHEHLPKKPYVLSFPSWWPNNEIFRERGPLLAVLLYALCGLGQIIFDEVLPLFSLLPAKQGGLGFSSREIGTLGAIGGVGMVLFQAFASSRILNYFGCRKSLRTASILLAPSYPVFPELSRFAGLDSTWSSVLLWIVLVLVYSWRTVMTLVCFTAVNILVNNSILPENRGRLNGIAQSSVALARALGPVGGASLFAWSNVNGLPFPLDNHFIYVIGSVVFVLIFGLSFLLRWHMDIPKSEAVAQKEQVLNESQP